MNIKKTVLVSKKNYFIFEHFFTLQNKQMPVFTSVEMTYFISFIVRCIPFRRVFLFPVSNIPGLKFNNVESNRIERKRIEFTSKNCLILVHFLTLLNKQTSVNFETEMYRVDVRQGRVVRKQINASLGLKVPGVLTFPV